MLMSGRYKGQPMAAHLRHDGAMTAANFDRWLALWRETTDDILDPKNAFVLQEKAARIAESLQIGVQFQRERLVRSCRPPCPPVCNLISGPRTLPKRRSERRRVGKECV